MRTFCSAEAATSMGFSNDALTEPRKASATVPRPLPRSGNTKSRRGCSMANAVVKMFLLAAPLVANAHVAASGELRPYSPPPGIQHQRKRRQISGAIFSQQVPGFDPLSAPWRCVRAPRNQPHGAEKQYTFLYDLESSVNPGTFSRVHIKYSDRSSEGAGALFAPIRTAARASLALEPSTSGMPWLHA
jgi:hypothetical protein